jgi:UDP-N-acetylmuramyl pentapeptide phosphotransferase/UDP-N-acetylglucosamine-1-phosphate transferase
VGAALNLDFVPVGLVDVCSQPRWWLVAALLSGLIAYLALRPIVAWLSATVIAHPNSRSSHAVPTPQGAGLVIVPAAITVAVLPFALNACSSSLAVGDVHVFLVLLGIVCLMGVGFLDDRQPLSITLRLTVQVLVAGVVAFTLPPHIRLSPIPLLVERAVLVVAILWCINLANFMDGIDLMSATETISIAIGIVALSSLGAVPPELGWIAAALGGTMIAFVPWNAPPARIFLGDAGSLPLGLALGLLLMHAAASFRVAPILILPLYYVVDATFTLCLRLRRGDKIWQPHREHFYQRAVRRGMSVPHVILLVGLTNMCLVALSILAALARNYNGELASLAVAALLVACTCYSLSRGRVSNAT